MGLFDYYRPKPEIVCPECGMANLTWQGKDGPCVLIVWESGESAPVDQKVSNDCKASAEQRMTSRLPARFEIYAACRCSTQVTAVGVTEHGVWTQTELLTPSNAVPYPEESDREFKKRLAAYAQHPGHAAKSR